MHTTVDWSRFEAVLFDLDGVITPTAIVHAAAWKRTFDAFLRATRGASPTPFSEDDYLRYVDGRPRYDGVRTFLASRDITLPEGEPSDTPGFDTVCALGNAKNEMFNEVLAEDGVDPYPGSMALVDHLDTVGVRTAIVSSSANARAVLDAAGVSDRFEVIVDGIVARRRGLRGKPAPDAFLEAAEEMGVAAARAVVVEDAVSGVAAGRAGAFGLVVGVARGGDPDELAAAGADVVVGDLSEVTPGADGRP
jgi:beta-phosphoglucomutase family hydrolase